MVREYSFSYEGLGAAKSPLPEFVILQGFGFYFNPGLAETDIPYPASWLAVGLRCSCVRGWTACLF